MRNTGLRQTLCALFALFSGQSLVWAANDPPVCAPSHPTCPPSPAVREINLSIAYPICFYDVESGAVASATDFWPEYSRRLSEALSVIAGAKERVQVLSSRTVVVRATAFRHRQIVNMWPEVACIGSSGGDASARRRGICVDFLRSQLQPNAAHKPPAARPEMAEPICQTFLEASKKPR